MLESEQTRRINSYPGSMVPYGTNYELSALSRRLDALESAQPKAEQPAPQSAAPLGGDDLVRRADVAKALRGWINEAMLDKVVAVIPAQPSDAAEMKAKCREAVSRVIVDATCGSRTYLNCLAAIDAIPVPPARTFADGVEAAAKWLENEAAAYEANMRECDKGGNTFGGTLDAAGASTCKNAADAIRKLKETT